MFVIAGLVLLGCAALLAAVRERRTRTASRGLDWPPLALIATGAALHVLLAESAGFIVAAALLFWFIARAFDARHPLRDGVCAIAVAVASYALFDYALQLPLPAGILGGWL